MLTQDEVEKRNEELLRALQESLPSLHSEMAHEMVPNGVGDDTLDYDRLRYPMVIVDENLNFELSWRYGGDLYVNSNGMSPPPGVENWGQPARSVTEALGLLVRRLIDLGVRRPD